MLATRIRQKDGTFYFISYKATDLLDRVRFTSRYYFEGEKIEQEESGDDEVARFIAGIEKNDKGFQRLLSRKKVRDIVNFYETAVSQPLIPGTVLLFTNEALRFEPVSGYQAVGNLTEPEGKYLVIDGQHRLAGLYFFRDKHPDQIDEIEVPCVLFDGKAADFATEMFVIINSTHTKINRSHLVDLYERVSWESQDKKFAAKVIKALYERADSPLQYKINRLGGRSRQQKWVLQSELFNELHKLVKNQEKYFKKRWNMRPEPAYELVRDYLKAVALVMEPAWGNNDKYIFTRDVTLKALIRVLGDLIESGAVERWEEDRSPKAFRHALAPWAEVIKEFRAEGFYERFPAKGQVERVRRIHERLRRLFASVGSGQEAVRQAVVSAAYCPLPTARCLEPGAYGVVPQNRRAQSSPHPDSVCPDRSAADDLRRLFRLAHLCSRACQLRNRSLSPAGGAA
ncbi:MAG: DGQHR domain-containing protein [Acidobacteriota bacterium]